MKILYYLAVIIVLINFKAFAQESDYDSTAKLLLDRLGEVITTFTMVSLLSIFIGFRQIRRFTPFMFPLLYAIMIPLEAAISRTSTSPARSLGPQ